MIDLTQAGMDDVIKHSYAIHPSLYSDAILARVVLHREYAAMDAQNATAKRIAIRMADDLEAAMHGTSLGQAQLGLRIMLFEIAANLQCIPRHIRTEIANREDSNT
jgi:hypothetical protein